MLPTTDELKPLQEAVEDSDDEAFHAEFDRAMENRLMQLDPEWMNALNKVADDSHMNFWYA